MEMRYIKGEEDIDGSLRFVDNNGRLTIEERTDGLWKRTERFNNND